MVSRRPAQVLMTAAGRLGSPFGSLMQRGGVRRYGDAALKHQPVFMIGAPRTGSTILYQAITNFFNVSYIDNLACRWHRSLYFGIWLSQAVYRDKPHNNFKSLHGDTNAFGGHAPSECGGFWYRWLPRDRHFVDAGEISESTVSEIRREIAAIINRWDRPLVFKNINAGQRLRLLKRCFPDARFIYLRRDMDSIVKSILVARARTGTPPDRLWSVHPRNYQDLIGLPEPEMVLEQVRSIEHQIHQDLQLFPKSNVIEIHFDQFSVETVRRLGAFIPAAPRRGGSLPAFHREM